MRINSMKIVLASNNQGKIAEIQTLVVQEGFEIIEQDRFAVPEVAEDGLTFVENALKKARNATTYTRLPALADDSGLVIPALGGAPGIYSSRYAGDNASSQENILKVLQQLQEMPDADRSAYFYCVLVLLRHMDDPCPIICEGLWQGKILSEPKGHYGFGYDPIFFDINRGHSAAEFSPEVKNEISHRGKAMKQLLQRIGELKLS